MVALDLLFVIRFKRLRSSLWPQLTLVGIDRCDSDRSATGAVSMLLEVVGKILNDLLCLQLLCFDLDTADVTRFHRRCRWEADMLGLSKKGSTGQRSFFASLADGLDHKEEPVHSGGPTTDAERRVAYLAPADNVSRPLPNRLRGMNQSAISPPIRFLPSHSTLSP
jgi:hypothetical protein